MRAHSVRPGKETGIAGLHHAMKSFRIQPVGGRQLKRGGITIGRCDLARQRNGVGVDVLHLPQLIKDEAVKRVPPLRFVQRQMLKHAVESIGAIGDPIWPGSRDDPPIVGNGAAQLKRNHQVPSKVLKFAQRRSPLGNPGRVVAEPDQVVHPVHSPDANL